MILRYGGHSMVLPLRRVVVKRPEEAFRSAEAIAAQWQSLNYLSPPDLDCACRDHANFVSILKAAGAEVLCLPPDDRTGLDSLYTHDPVLVTDRGAIIFRTGKPERRGEGAAFAEAFNSWGVPILGALGGAASAEAGDLVWLDAHTLAAGRGFRTNAAGIRELERILKPLRVNVVPVPLPYWNGQQEVLHLMSFISMLDGDLAVVYRRLMPVPFIELLEERGIQLIDIPEEEYDSMGANVLALSPRKLLMLSGNPITRSRLEAVGCEVTEFDGSQICIPGAGGPTCLTRPLLRT